MKPCPKNQKDIALLALNALEPQRQKELRAHLGGCAGCRGYLGEISNVAENLRAVEPQSQHPQPSAVFHRNVVGALAGAKPRSGAETFLAQLWAAWSWRMILPPAAAAAMVIAAWLLAAPHTRVIASAPIARPVALVPNGPRYVLIHPDFLVDKKVPRRAVAASPAQADLAPTFSNYEMAAHQSLDKLDALLDHEGNRNVAHPPVYAVALLSRANASE